jgi:hypothetical protein
MTLRLIPIALMSLSLTGCVAAIPMVAQLATSANSTAQLCSMTKMPGQASSLCDRIGFGQATQPPAKAPDDAVVKTAARTPKNTVKEATVTTTDR